MYISVAVFNASRMLLTLRWLLGSTSYTGRKFLSTPVVIMVLSWPFSGRSRMWPPLATTIQSSPGRSFFIMGPSFFSLPGASMIMSFMGCPYPLILAALLLQG
ncbi:hypothetical protein D3C81_2067370 [compost metagenome]